jgi:endonuclease YncB( thermonuclease family)
MPASCGKPSGRLPFSETIEPLTMRRLIFLLAIPFVIFAHDAMAEIAGRATVIDGDTIEIRGQRVRLFGIDSPESAQLCQAGQKPYRCGQQAALALADRIGERTVRCQERDKGRYGRVVAVCYVGSEDLDRWMVEQGWAIAMVEQGWAMAFRKYSLDYVDAEDDAREAGRGIWQGEFEMPWEWRRARRNP